MTSPQPPQPSLQDILDLARQRAHALGLPYTGALLPAEAWRVWQEAPNAQLVDVRTRAELDWVGRVPHAVEIEWVCYPENLPNDHFLDQLRAAVPPPEPPLLFLCRSGGRSNFAARLAHMAGYRVVYNILEGFEGPLDRNHQRGNAGGWRHAGLPWHQS